MASASITITVTDTANHPLATIRDTVLVAINYPGGGTAQQKLDFIEAYLADHLKKMYLQQLERQRTATPVAIEAEINIV